MLRTTNFITQALTLAFCSAFVFVRGLQKVRVSAFSWSVDDREPPPLGIDPSSTSFFELKLTGSTDLTIVSWLFLVAYCTAGVLSVLSLRG